MNVINSLLMCVGALLLYNVHFCSTKASECYIPTNLDAVNKFQPLVRSPRQTYPKSNSTNIFLNMSKNSRENYRNEPYIIFECSGNSHLVIESQRLPENVDPNVVKVDCDQETDTSAIRYRLSTYFKQTDSNLFAIFIDMNNKKPIKPENVYVKNFADIGCSREQLPKARANRDIGFCPRRWCTTCIEIGFFKPTHLPVINFIAIDTSKMRPYLALTYIPSAIANRQVGNNNSWAIKEGPFFKKLKIVKIEEVYQRNYQRKVFFEIFRDQNLVDVYISETGDSYLTSGKLFTERDFFYTYEQRSVFFYENTMPVWSSIATGNWELAADFLRKLIGKYSQNHIRVFSGSYGTLQLRDQQGNLKKIFLARGPEDERVIPVPEFLFKYAPLNLTDVSEGQLWDGLVLVTVNNPHLTKDELIKEGYLKPSCSSKPICQQLMPEFANIIKGYTFCCSVKEFEPIAKDLDLRPYTLAGK